MTTWGWGVANDPLEATIFLVLQINGISTLESALEYETTENFEVQTNRLIQTKRSHNDLY